MTEAAFALVSRAGRAVVRRGETYHVLTVDVPEPQLADGTHWAHLRALHPLAERMPAGEPPFTAVRARMREVWREQLGLDLLLMTFDRDHDDAFRRETCLVLEGLFGEEPWLCDRLREIVLSIEPPAEADLAGAKSHAEAVGAPLVARMAGELIEASETIGRVQSAWHAAVKALNTPSQRSESMTVGDGLFAIARAVMALRDPESGAWDRLRVWCRETFEPALAAATADAAGVLDRWLSALEKSRTATSDLLEITDPAALSLAIRARLSAETPPDGADRCRLDAVVRAAERHPGGDERARFAQAVITLFGDLVMRPDEVPLSLEWPAGLFVLARHVQWTEDERANLRPLMASVLYHVRRNPAWSVGAPKGIGVGSPVLEAHRAVRFLGMDPEEHRPTLVVSCLRLAPKPRMEADPELGSVLGILSSYDRASAITAVEQLRGLDPEGRSRVLVRLGREHRAWASDIAFLVDALLTALGGVGDIRSIHRPTASDQRWAAEAARSLGALSNEQAERVNDLLVPQKVAVKKTIPAPHFATGRKVA